MTFAAQLAVILTHATTAGAAVSPAIDDVQVAYPLPRGRCVRIFYDGEQDATLIPSTLTEENIDEVVHVSAFWPLSNLGETDAAAIETQLYAFKHAFRTAIDGNTKLGGTCDDATLRNAQPGYALLGGGEFRVLDFEIVISHTSYTLVN